MKKKIVYWVLQKIHLPIQQDLTWKIRLLGKLSKNDYILTEEDKITIVKKYRELTKITELFISLDRSEVYIHAKNFGEHREGNLERGLLGIL